jgi:hypothetical protein
MKKKLKKILINRLSIQELECAELFLFPLKIKRNISNYKIIIIKIIETFMKSRINEQLRQTEQKVIAG